MSNNKFKLILLAIAFTITSCGERVKVVSPGYVSNGNGTIVKMGPHHQFLDVLHNGDSLFEYYNVDSVGWEHTHLYYTSNMGKTKDINWNTGGKFSKLESNLQQ